jgi:hypothetical protein
MRERPVRKDGQFERILVGFGARVDEEELVVVVARGFAQTFGELHLEQLVDNRVAVEAQLLQLCGHHLHVVGMAMADADNRMTPVEVKILLPFVVPYMAAFALDDVYVEEAIYIEKFHLMILYYL